MNPELIFLIPLVIAVINGIETNFIEIVKLYLLYQIVSLGILGILNLQQRDVNSSLFLLLGVF